MDGRALPPGLAAGLDLQKVGMFGFSLGGYATANTLLEDQRFAAGLDLDGTLQDDPVKGPLGVVARKGLDQPFLLFGSDTSQRTDAGKEYYDKSWAGFWEAQRGWKLNLAQRRYISAIFDQTLRRRPEMLLRGSSPKFPEVHFAR